MPELMKTSQSHSFLLLFLLLGIALPQGLVLPCCFALRSPVATTSVAPGSHCPLMHQSSHSEKRDEHHCPMHEQGEKSQRQELRCHCCPSPLLDASPDVSATRFLFPHLTTDKLSPYATRLYVSYHFLISTVTLVPPDPPPRTALFAFR